MIETKPHAELAEAILEESGYTEMWQRDRTAEAAGRLENLKELVRAMDEFPNLASFLEHISLVMDTADKDSGARVSIMTLHAAKGSNSRRSICRAGRKGCFRRSVRSMRTAAPVSKKSGASLMSA
jgi:superfamily I DNA/RNA helicase